MLRRFRRAYNTPWGQSTRRYVGDGRPFWRHIVRESTGCESHECFEAIFDYYSQGDAYFVTAGAVESLQRIRSQGALRGEAGEAGPPRWAALRSAPPLHATHHILLTALL